MSYSVSTPVFEGPLELLLQLITSHQVQITELSLSDLVSEYLATLDQMRDLDIDVTSEFLLIAATLIQLKARYLLPDDREIDLDEELALAEERDRLLARLLACLTYKDVGAVIQHRMSAAARYTPRLVGLPAAIRPAIPEVEIPLTPAQLALLAERVIHRRPEAPDLDHLDFDLPSVDDAIADLRRRIHPALVTDFDSLVAHCDRQADVVAYFLALLELARWGLVSVNQVGSDEAITVEGRASESPFETQSEWT